MNLLENIPSSGNENGEVMPIKAMTRPQAQKELALLAREEEGSARSSPNSWKARRQRRELLRREGKRRLARKKKIKRRPVF